MKLIHTADLHLDAAMDSLSDKGKAAERKNELLLTFSRIADYAADCGAAGVLLVGDLFDRKRISAAARDTVLAKLRKYPQLQFYYLKGNHDSSLFTEKELPDNLHLFGKEWTSYELGKVSIFGRETDAGNGCAAAELLTDPGRINLVLLHGQTTASAGSRPEDICLKDFKNRGIDYLALGHIHSYERGTLDARGTYCYPGCPEGRGFDECGEKGFVLLEIDEEKHTVTDSFIPFAGRKLFEIAVNAEGCTDTAEALARAEQTLAEAAVGSENLVKLVLRGAIDIGTELSAGYLEKELDGRYYYLRVKDETVPRVDYNEYLHDESLKGEFVRLVMAEVALTEEEKAAVIRCGLNALAGEEPEE